MLTRWLGQRAEQILNHSMRGLQRLGLTPNMLTATGLVLNAIAAFFFARGWLFFGGVLVLVANIFDVMDGQFARRTGQVTRFGAFFDSVIDRYSDMFLLLGLIFYYTRMGERLILFFLGLALIGSIMTSYTRARAECIIPSCKVGVFERPERIGLIILGALLNRMTTAIFLLAIFSNFTVVERILHTRKVVRAMERENATRPVTRGESDGATPEAASS